MFTYYFIDNNDIQTPSDFAYDSDYDYLMSKVTSGEYKALIIASRIF